MSVAVVRSNVDGHRRGLLPAARSKHGVRFTVDVEEGVLVEVRYWSHQKDLVALGCVTADQLANMLSITEDGHGGRLWLGASGCGIRNWRCAVYSAPDPAYAASLPGVRDLFPEAFHGRPALRLVHSS
jgi:hypothetical protein